MNIVQITPGAGGMICGNCLRDNALVAALRRKGHQALMVPLYLPIELDEPDQSAGTPIFFGGISVYLEQKGAVFRRLPRWVHRALASPVLLRLLSRRFRATRPANLGQLTLSMLAGQDGNQAREVDALVDWLGRRSKPDVVLLSNALLGGLIARLRSELRVPVVCMLQGEDSFLDALAEPHRSKCWQAVGHHAGEADLLMAPSHYFAQRMRERLGLPGERLRVVYNGIALEDYARIGPTPNPEAQTEPVIGFLARMCREKGLDTLVEGFISLRRRGCIQGVKLRLGGYCGPGDEAFVRSLRRRLGQAELLHCVDFSPNLSRRAKLEFLQSLSIFSVPARCGEAFGLYLLEAMAAGVPVVQPATAAFPELIEATGGGVLYSANDPSALAASIEELLLDPERRRRLGEAGRRAVFSKFSAESMADAMLEPLQRLSRPRAVA